MNRRLIRRVSKLRQRGITTIIVAILLLIIGIVMALEYLSGIVRARVQ